MVTPRKPRGELQEVVRRSARRLEAEGRIARRIPTTPGRAFKCAPDDIKVSRTAPDGSSRDKEQALEVARRREPSAEYKGSDARWFVFTRGTP